jgi:Leucine-rich repeat (LRR) protein
MQRTTSKTDQQLIDLLKAEAPKKPSNVNLEGRDIQLLPTEIGLFTDCERMGLNNNSLVTLPFTFTQLPFLKYLNLRSNRFREFPPALLSLPKLEVLDISKNKISSFPADPGSLVNLKVLSVSRNRLEFLPKYLPNFKNLKLLKIDNNPLKWPPHTVTTCLDELDKKWIINLFQYISENGFKINSRAARTCSF